MALPPAQGLQLQAEVPLQPGIAPEAGELVAAIAQLYPAPPNAGIEAVLESAWLPVMRVETGGTLVSDAQAIALVQHRLQRLYDTPRDPVAGWEVRVDFRAGDAYALGFGLSPRVHSALRQAADRAGFKWRAITPAWQWGWNRAWQRASRQAAGLSENTAAWWGWLEQDRLMLAHVENADGGHVPLLASLHAGLAPNLMNPHDLRRQIDAAAISLGLPDTPRSVRMAAWTPTPSGMEDAHLQWLCVAGPQTAQSAPIATGNRQNASRKQTA